MKDCFLKIIFTGILLSFMACNGRNHNALTEQKQIDSIIPLCKDTITLSEWIERASAEGRTEITMLLKKERGNLLYDYAMFHESIFAYYEALKDAKQVKDTLETIRIINKLGKVFMRMEFADEAVNCHLEALRFYDEYGDKNTYEAFSQLAKTYTGLGNAYLELGEKNKATDFYQKSLEIETKQRNYKGQAINYVGLGMVMENEKNYETAEDYFKQALKSNQRINNQNGIITCHNRFGLLAEKKGNWNMALHEYEHSHKIAQETRDMNHFIEASISMARIYIKKGETETARPYLQVAIENATLANAYKSLSKAYLLLSKCDEKQNLKSALDNYKKSVSYYDSVRNERKFLSTLRIIADYEKEKEQEKIDAMQQGFKSRQKKTDYILLIAAAIILLAVGLILTMAYALKQRKQSQKLQANMEKMRSDFFTNITHEFRTPLTVINGISEYLMQKIESTQIKQQLDIVKRQGQQLLTLVNQLLDISKIQSAVGNPIWCEGDIVAILEMAIESMNVLALQKKIDVVFVKNDSNIIMDLVPDYANKILYNLLTNAIKYTPHGGKIIVRVKQEKTEVKITIFNNGAGISDDELSFVFDKFYQGNIQHGYIGTGVGLSMVRQMTEAMKGKVEVYSIKGRGTAFDICLPKKHSAQKLQSWNPKGSNKKSNIDPFPVPVFQIEALFPDDQMVDAQKPSALIVEDNADVSSYIGTILSEEFNLRYAKNGKEALEKINEFIIDVIVSDIIMPEMDGIELVRQVRNSEHFSHIPIVIVTAKNEEKDRLEVLEAGADIYLAKPFLPKELSLALNKLLEQRKQLKEIYANEAIESLEDETVNYDRRNMFLSKLHDVVHAEMNNSSFNSEKLASLLCISRSQLNRKVKNSTGKDTATFIREQRMAMAHKLLKTTDIPISDIVIKCGFEYQTYFNRVYKAKYGETPTQTREKK